MTGRFPAKLSALRRERGLSQRSASESLGISQALLSHYENGAREPGLDFIVRAAAFYGVSTDFLLCADAARQPDGAYSEYFAAIRAFFDALPGAELRGAAEDWLSLALYKLLPPPPAGGINDGEMKALLSLALRRAALRLDSVQPPQTAPEGDYRGLIGRAERLIIEEKR